MGAVSLSAPPADPDSIRLRVLSLGVGGQSTTLALMAAHGEIGPMPDCSIFADTGWEPAAIVWHISASKDEPCWSQAGVSRWRIQ